MKTTTIRNTLFVLLATATTSFAQSGLPCGTTEYDNQWRAAHPEENQLFQQGEQQLEQARQNMFQHGEGRTGFTYTIPIVFHIIHDYGTEDISDAQVLDEVAILNRDYAKLNADTANITPSFQALASECNIQFRLATIDPDGNCTNGIERIASKRTNNADDGAKLNPWPRKSYLNVWVVKTIGAAGVAGYAYFPSSVQGLGMTVDGVLILSSYIGSIGTGTVGTSRALTHEIGHYLSLEHPWGGTNSPGVACGDDGIPDTPQTKGWDHCPTAQQSKVCDTTIVENYQNYMDYSYCSVMFTHDQMLAMHATLNSAVSDRIHLWQPSNLVATGTSTTTASNCAPIADFHANHNFVCAGGSITFTDASGNAAVTTRSWSFPGGTPSTSTATAPAVVYSTSGVYLVTLVATNAQGSDSITKSNYIHVGEIATNLTAPYSESFEDPNVLNHGWTVVNYSNDDVFWRTNTATALTGNSSMILNDYDNDYGEVDELISPPFDLRYLSGITMTFKEAFASQVIDTSMLKEKLKVYGSTNCGQTWTPVLTQKAFQLLTGGATANYFIPPVNDPTFWKTYTINLSSTYAQAGVIFKFEFDGGNYGNEFYLDDLNINAVGVGIQNPDAEQTSVNIFPNPTNGNSSVELFLDKNEHLDITLTDLNGRMIKQIASNDFNAGGNSVPFTTEGVAPGIYFVTVFDGTTKQVKKLAITN